MPRRKAPFLGKNTCCMCFARSDKLSNNIFTKYSRIAKLSAVVPAQFKMSCRRVHLSLLINDDKMFLDVQISISEFRIFGLQLQTKKSVFSGYFYLPFHLFFSRFLVIVSQMLVPVRQNGFC